MRVCSHNHSAAVCPEPTAVNAAAHGTPTERTAVRWWRHLEQPLILEVGEHHHVATPAGRYREGAAAVLVDARADVELGLAVAASATQDVDPARSVGHWRAEQGHAPALLGQRLQPVHVLVADTRLGDSDQTCVATMGCGVRENAARACRRVTGTQGQHAPATIASELMGLAQLPYGATVGALPPAPAPLPAPDAAADDASAMEAVWGCVREDV